ncbi:MAG: saccharopine dehydrogenase NADP-binding domain-containing protein [Candidatus Thermoplasmatota archaeon]
MKSVVLGGAGVEGSFVVDYLSKSEVFSDVTIADINKEAGKKLSEKYQNTDYVFLDASDKKKVSKVLKDADVAVNCIGPFYKFAPPIMEAAIESSVDIVDICDDYDMTETLIDEYDKKAKDAGITSIVGLGASPGTTNIIASLAAKNLDSVKDIKIFVVRGIKEEAGAAIPYHMMHCWIGNIPIFKNGRLKKVQGLLDGEEYVNFPDPFGQVPVYYFGHPESVTLPRYIDGLENVCCKGTFFPDEFREALLNIKELGLNKEEPHVDVFGNKIKPVDFLASYIGSITKEIQEKHSDVPTGASVMVRVSGEKESEPMMYEFVGTSRMKEATATPAAIGAEMIVEDQIDSPGVQAPEGCVPPELFLGRLLQGEEISNTFFTVRKRLKSLDVF